MFWIILGIICVFSIICSIGSKLYDGMNEKSSNNDLFRDDKKYIKKIKRWRR